MKHLLMGTLLTLAIVLAGCADHALTPTSEPAAEPSEKLSGHQVDPFAILSGRSVNIDGATAGHRAKAATFGFIQGLEAAPNGDIMVADLAAGIGSRNRGIEIALPGVTDIGPIGRGAMWATTGPVGDGEDCVAGETTFLDCGQALYRATKGKNRLIANLFAFEETYNPDGAGIDSNPYDVQSLRGRAALVADAAGNDLLRVNNRGRVDVLAVFPPGDPVPIAPGVEIRPEAVPTSIAIGPDGHYFVGELTGFPAPLGASSIWKVAPGASWANCGSSSDCVKVFDGGFTSIIDLAFGAEGTLYVAELDEQSWLEAPSAAGGTINACDLDAGTCTEVATGIPFLTAITIGKRGTLWATANFATRVVQP